ncbi:hypothetical protein VOLCADRAFT_88506 [Volvox carteri f. nagariensis]|uniref:Uncharacterized protein n=1 Tax=Volvox carteri f. nagariensis TaxID=3068 RepID=D8TP69_VOLCA|nr:uncharacterized protein VOLCADRAFT_88506 [Volvox carteri f. nagariensis]EFJ50709.1 hypothetical protein VOLCADRAFT_88506 [Volvox carteri f. nagariensis]|eukprot:XP_002948302.1 hypothetical protein VOLCADRAFT_88506 [Volvox carteri f. nagariensis]
MRLRTPFDPSTNIFGMHKILIVSSPSVASNHFVMDLLAAGYGSDSGNDEDATRTEEPVPKPAAHTAPRNEPADDSGDDSAESSDESLDSAELRAAQAAARLRDFGETATSGRQRQQQPQQHPQATTATRSALPSALDVLDQVEGPPTFLDPEAIRPLATSALHGLSDEQAAALAGGPGGRGAGSRGERQQPGKDFDISRLAPPLKGQSKPSADKREGPPGAIIEGRAKRYKAQEEGPGGTQQYTAAQIAMMGGNVDGMSRAAGGPTKPMEVSEFLNKGLGAAQLPRRTQDRKDKEKQKRTRGQSTHSHWKSEAEMVLRQQFDS